MRYVYDNGLPFNGPLKENLDRQIERVENGKASLIIVDGGVGEGKTTFITHILDYINSKKGLPPIDISKKGPQLGLGGVEFTKKLRVCYEDKLPCCGYDEAGDFSKRGSISHFNSMINRTFETYRAFKCVVVMGLPNFNILDQQIFDNKIPRLLLHLKNRSKNTGYYYGYSLYKMDLLKYYMGKAKIKNYAYKRVWPNFMGTFLNLPPERCKQLDEVTISNKLSILKKSEIKLEGLISYPEMASKLMRSLIWTKKAVADLNIKPKRIISRAKYFDNEALAKLTEHLEIKTDRRKR